LIYKKSASYYQAFVNFENFGRLRSKIFIFSAAGINFGGFRRPWSQFFDSAACENFENLVG